MENLYLLTTLAGRVKLDRGGSMDWVWPAILIGVGLVGLIVIYFAFKYLSLWLQAMTSQAPVKIMSLIGMQFRKIDPRTIVIAHIQGTQAGIDTTINNIETHYLAGGRVRSVINAMIAADRANIKLDWNTACAIDLAGRDILEAVQTSVNPKVIDCPNPAHGTDRLDAVAKDGIRLLCKARVTVRANIQNLIGGATEETVVARVGQAIVSGIGSSASYNDVLENPDGIAKKALASGLAAGTAYEILSIDIADISVAGVDREANVGAKVQAEQAEADKRRYQAEAERRRALAVAEEQEYKAQIHKNRALVVLAEAEVPKAMAEAFRSGNLGIMDYYKMNNIKADTAMRGKIAGDNQGNKAK